MVPAEASPQEAEAGVQHAEQPTLEASSKKAPAGLRRSSSQADARPARHERLRSEPSRPQSAPRQRSARGSRYFLLKSISLENIEISVAQGIWATQVCSIVCTKLWLPCQSLPSKSAWTPLYHSRAEVLAPGPCLTFSSKCYTEGRVQARISYSQDQKPRLRPFIVGANCSQLFLSCQAQTASQDQAVSSIIKLPNFNFVESVSAFRRTFQHRAPMLWGSPLACDGASVAVPQTLQAFSQAPWIMK